MKKANILFALIVTPFLSVTAQQLPSVGFETWSNNGLVIPGYLDPTGWITGNFATTGNPSKSTDSHSGNSAVKLESSITGNQTNIGTLTLGNVNQLLSGNFSAMIFGPGIGFIDKPDSLVAWVKYSTSQNNHFAIGSHLSKWNSTTHSMDTIAKLNYQGNACSNYTRISIPFHYSNQFTTLTPDSIRVYVYGKGSSGNLGDDVMTLLIDDVSLIYNTATNSLIENKNNNLSFFPNPVNDKLTLSVKEEDSFIIYNSIGLAIETFSINNNQTIQVNTASYPNGIYFISSSKGLKEKLIINN